MPQRGEREVGIHFGRISPQCWERIKEQPGAIVEKAIPMLVEARSAGRRVHYRPTLKVGVSKKLWLTPGTVETIDRVSAATGLRRTPIILAALDLYFGGAPAGLGQAED